MSTPRYVWGKWNKVENTYFTYSVGKSSATSKSGSRRGNNYKIDTSTGKVTFDENGTSVPAGSSGSWKTYYASASTLTYPATFYETLSKWEWQGGSSYIANVYATYKCQILQKTNVYYSKGGNSYGNVSSSSSGAYSSNGVTGDYWYVSAGSDCIDPDSLTYTDSVSAGQDVNLTITPSSSASLGGTITYVIQTTTNGTDWYDVGETTGTSYAVTVPSDAIVWGVRVYAKDDMGFVSSTYVYGNGIEGTVNVIRVGIAPDSGDIGFITSPQVMNVSVNTDGSYTFNVSLNGSQISSTSGNSSTVQTITLTDEQFAGLEENTPYTLTVDIVQSGTTITRTYTFRKFTYDDTTTAGVFDGAARALRIKRNYTTSIIGANIPKEIIKIDIALKQISGSITMSSTGTYSIPVPGTLIAAVVKRVDSGSDTTGAVTPDATSTTVGDKAGHSLSFSNGSVTLNITSDAGYTFTYYVFYND